MFNGECDAMVDMIFNRRLNKGQGHSFWHQSIFHILLSICCQLLGDAPFSHSTFRTDYERNTVGRLSAGRKIGTIIVKHKCHLCRTNSNWCYKCGISTVTVVVVYVYVRKRFQPFTKHRQWWDVS